jgi:hypothetical protein
MDISSVPALDKFTLMVYHYRERSTLEHDERSVFQTIFRPVFSGGKKEDS